MKDLPSNQKITIFEPRSLFGYDDLLYKEGFHSTTVKCTSMKGRLFLMRKEQFFRLRKSQNSWHEVQKMVAYRTYRQNADDIHEDEMIDDVDKEESEYVKQLRTEQEPWLFDMLVGDRKEKLNDNKGAKEAQLASAAAPIKDFMSEEQALAQIGGKKIKHVIKPAQNKDSKESIKAPQGPVLKVEFLRKAAITPIEVPLAKAQDKPKALSQVSTNFLSSTASQN